LRGRDYRRSGQSDGRKTHQSAGQSHAGPSRFAILMRPAAAQLRLLEHDFQIRRR
jgi:hypothetical protein